MRQLETLNPPCSLQRVPKRGDLSGQLHGSHPCDDFFPEASILKASVTKPMASFSRGHAVSAELV